MLHINRSKVLALFLFAASIFLAFPRSLKACDEIPQTLLSLYMNSDVVVLANYESDGASNKTHQDEYGYTLELERNLRIIKVLKGSEGLETIVFRSSDYFPAQPDDVTDFDHSGNYFDVSKIKMGNAYLFFLARDVETESYYVTDYSSGVKDVRGSFGMYEKSLSELASIIQDRKNQLPRLTEWMVKLLEEPETRFDAVNDLSESFYATEYVEDAAAEPSADSLSRDNYYGFLSQMGKTLNADQKSRISSALYPYLLETWFAAEPLYVDYGVSNILSNINRSRLALFTYNSLQSVDKADSKRRNIIMSFLSDSIRDEELSEIYYEITSLESDLSEISKLTDAASKAKAKTMRRQLDQLMIDFDARFKFMHKRNFAPIVKA